MTGFLLAGIGQRDKNGANFLVVDASACFGVAHGTITPPAPPPTLHPPLAETPRDAVESAFTRFASSDEVGLIIISQAVADIIRPLITAHTATIPLVLELSGGADYDPTKDPLMKRVLSMLGEA